MINNYFVDDDKVYTYDTSDNKVSQLEYQDNIDEVFRLKNKREILEDNLETFKNILNTVTENEQERKFANRLALGLFGGLAAFMVIANLFRIFGNLLILPQIIMFAMFSGIIFVVKWSLNSGYLSHKDFIKRVKELEAQINYLEEELAKVKEAEEQAKNNKTSKANDLNYSRDLDSYNKEERQLLQDKLILIARYLNNKEKYQYKLQNGELAQNPEEENLIRELIKKEQ